MLKIKACIMSIAHPKRLLWLHETIKHLENQKFPFYKKVIVIDVFGGWTVPDFIIKKLEDWNWEIKRVSLRSRTKAMDLFFEDDETDIIFYNEEDVKINLPDYNVLKNMFLNNINERKCGLISLDLGGTEFHREKKQYGDWVSFGENIVYKDNDYVFFRRDECKKNDWFIGFPGIFMRNDLFEKCHNHSKTNFKGSQVEIGLTKAWFDLKIDKDYCKLGLCKPNIFDYLKEDISLKFLDQYDNPISFLTLLDPQQGSSPVGGNHTY